MQAPEPHRPGKTDFNQETNIYMWASQGHRRLIFPAVLGTTQGQPITSQTPFIRNNPVFNYYDNLSWVKGKHVFTFGGAAPRGIFS